MFSDKLTCPILKFTYHSKKSGGPKGSRNCSYKKERKENIKNVFREAYLPNPKVYLLFQKIQESGGFKETVSTKKKEKRTLGTFSEKPIHPKPNFTYPFSFYFQFPEIRSPKSCSYKKERERTLAMFFFKENLTPPETYLLRAGLKEISCSKTSNFQRFRVHHSY